MTEKAIEDLLVFESRSIRLPGGKTKRFTAMRLHWYSYDFIVRTGFFTEEKLLSLVLREASQPNGYTFAGSFRCVVSFVHAEMIKAKFRNYPPSAGPLGLAIHLGGSTVGVV